LSCIEYLTPCITQEKEIGYRAVEIPVQPYNEEGEVLAKAFLSSPLLLLASAVAPPAKYLAKLSQGAEENKLSEEYRQWLASLPTAKDLSDSAYNNTPADLLGRLFSLALLSGITWALIT